MKILALDSSGLVASAAVVEDDILTAEFTMNYKKTHSQTLLPMLETIRDMTELDLDTVDAIAVAAGPGSFTGLRIGSATAKGLGLALKKPIVAVPTVDALAYVLYGSSSLVCPIMDARRGQVYTGIYAYEKKERPSCEEMRLGQVFELKTIRKQCAVAVEEIVEELNSLGREVIFLGDGIPVFEAKLAERMKVPYSFAPAHMNRQRAAAVAALAEIYYQQGRLQTAEEHAPEYLRLSQAERERQEAEQAGKQI
ncbi:MAG: tRNA (adenosine(37)-N6)-threonylcarbamoyltransferase complex dimerization subunit type 1 TsaB [Lachnospiraceae bacterium]|nr:tRNA (adenosine(37)-N6)-threonylcarbamoyltransferase complex dimerization subunit type 1 TsaB [Lachnospiraceae bacterium]